MNSITSLVSKKIISLKHRKNKKSKRMIVKMRKKRMKKRIKKRMKKIVAWIRMMALQVSLIMMRKIQLKMIRIKKWMRERIKIFLFKILISQII